MATVEQVYALLVGQKIKDDAGLWHVYDENGNEISDPGGVMFRGNMGALLMWPSYVEPETQYQHPTSRAAGGPRRVQDAPQAYHDAVRRSRIRDEDDELMVLVATFVRTLQ
jgi:hypothetical protein